MAHLRHIHGRYVKSPFKELEEEESKGHDLFEYDPQRGVKGI